MKPSFDFATVMQLPGLPDYLVQVERGLQAALTPHSPLLKQPLERLLQARGKRLRPALVLAAAASQGAIIDKHVIAGAVVIELIHMGSLVHDDIIDEATTRRSAPTINAKEGVRHAILAGDYLLAAACQQAAGISPEAGQLVASTIMTLCEGESLELSDQYNMNRSMESLQQTMHDKTAALMAAACQMGGLCADLPAPQVAALAQYGEAFGLAFQLIDDVLDFVSTPELLGKPIGNDVREGVYTMPVLEALRGPQAAALQKMLQQKGALSTSDLTSLLLRDGAIERTLSKAQKNNEAAAAALKAFGEDKVLNGDHTRLSGSTPHERSKPGRFVSRGYGSPLNGLRNLPNYYLTWAIHQQVAPVYRDRLALG